MKLSEEQVKEFHERGVLIAENVLTDDDFAPLIKEINALVDRRARELKAEGEIADLCEGLPFEQRVGAIYNQSKQVIKGLDIVEYRGAEVFHFLRNENLMDAVECLVGSEISCNPIQHLRAKVPNLEGGGAYGLSADVPWHQDAGVAWEEAEQSEIVTCWIPLVDATLKRGCMEIIPNVFRDGYIDHASPSGTQITPDKLPEESAICAECPKGGVVFMSRHTPHRGLVNTSDTVRWTLDLRYQKTGSPTGRPFYPDFPTRSRSNPDSVLTDHAEWNRLWDEGLAAGEGKPWHRPQEEAMRRKAS